MQSPKRKRARGKTLDGTSRPRRISKCECASLLRGYAVDLEGIKRHFSDFEWRTWIPIHREAFPAEANFVVEVVARRACGAWAWIIRHGLLATDTFAGHTHGTIGRWRQRISADDRLDAFTRWAAGLPGATGMPPAVVGRTGCGGDAWIWALRTVADLLDRAEPGRERVADRRLPDNVQPRSGRRRRRPPQCSIECVKPHTLRAGGKDIDVTLPQFLSVKALVTVWPDRLNLGPDKKHQPPRSLRDLSGKDDAHKHLKDLAERHPHLAPLILFPTVWGEGYGIA